MRCKRNRGGEKDPQNLKYQQFVRKLLSFFFLILLMKLHESLFKKEGDGVKAFGGFGNIYTYPSSYLFVWEPGGGISLAALSALSASALKPKW